MLWPESLVPRVRAKYKTIVQLQINVNTVNTKACEFYNLSLYDLCRELFGLCGGVPPRHCWIAEPASPEGRRCSHREMTDGHRMYPR